MSPKWKYILPWTAVGAISSALSYLRIFSDHRPHMTFAGLAGAIISGALAWTLIYAAAWYWSERKKAHKAD